MRNLKSPNKEDDVKRISQILQDVQKLWEAQPEKSFCTLIYEAVLPETLGDFASYTDDQMLQECVREQIADLQTNP